MQERSLAQILRQKEGEIRKLRSRLEETEETLEAIRNGEVDAIVVSHEEGQRIYTLRGAEYSYRILVEQMGEGALTLSGDGTILYCNRRFAHMTAKPIERIMGSNIKSLISSQDHEALEQAMKLRPREVKSIEVLVRNVQGIEIPVRLTLTFLPEESPPTVCAIVTDLTEIKRREKDSAREKERLEQRVMERTADLTAKKNELEASNKRIREAMKDSDAAREKLEALNRQLKREIARRKNEVKEKESLQAQLLQSQKMEAIGSLAGGVAHDFNNLLTTIMGNAQLALTEIERDSPLFEDVREIIKAGDKAAALTHQLLAFSRKEVRQPEVLNVNETILDMEKMLRRLIREDIDLQLMLDPNLNDIYIDPVQINQVIMNLVVNAKDAMPEGGKLTVETSNAELDISYFRKRGLEGKAGQYVLLAISDTGVGMDEELRTRIFEPFFTTKERGIGTGLGLSTVHGIVSQNRGHIWPYSEPGCGTTMKVYLPKAKKTKDTERGIYGRGEDLSGSELVLLAEDDDNVRNFAKKALLKYGYNVIESKNGDDAIRVSQEFVGKIDLLLTDVVMPGMKGKDLAERLQSSRTDLRVLYMSGYTHNVITSHGIIPKDIDFIEKPFSPTKLARKVREVLDRQYQKGNEKA
ncbi:MAG: response regulator [Deltaproteobacteria bacterium]|nr:response regulator [Deltaproteobacteria bacterium]MBW2066027.1 response regulator [Deltaproteobacteria bacterium]